MAHKNGHSSDGNYETKSSKLADENAKFERLNCSGPYSVRRQVFFAKGCDPTRRGTKRVPDWRREPVGGPGTCFHRYV